MTYKPPQADISELKDHVCTLQSCHGAVVAPLSEAPQEGSSVFFHPLASSYSRVAVSSVFCAQNIVFRPRCVCVCVCVFSSHPFWTSSSLDVPAGVTQEEGPTGRISHPPSFCGACLNFSREKDSAFLSLVDREVEFCVLTI